MAKLEQSANVTVPIKYLLSFCSNCGEKGPHFVPPSMGDRGFFMCKPNPELVKKKTAEIREKHGTISET